MTSRQNQRDAARRPWALSIRSYRSFRSPTKLSLKTVAAILNRLGYKTGQEKTWNASRVAGLRGYHKIAPFQKQDSWVTQEEAARELQVSDTVVKRLIRERVLPAKQVVKFAPWIIDKKDLLLPAVQQQVKAARRGAHRLPQIVLGQGQLSLE